MRELRESDTDRPYFLYLHFMDPHIDYDPPAAWWSPAALAYEGPVDGQSGTLRDATRGKAYVQSDADTAQWCELYSNEVSYLDHQLGRLLDGLAERGLYTENTLLVFTSDHGEQFGEHGLWEHGDLHIENVRVPLMLRAPGQAPAVRDDAVSLLDIAPTVLARLGLPPLPHAEGRALAQPPGEPPRAVVTEYGHRRRVSDGRWALLLEGPLQRRLYDLVEDPEETRDLSREHPGEVLRLAEAFALHILREPLELPPQEAVPTPSRDLQAMRELGYVGDDADR
jgi:arylsulfatase A-like enzyme